MEKEYEKTVEKKYIYLWLELNYQEQYNIFHDYIGPQTEEL